MGKRPSLSCPVPFCFVSFSPLLSLSCMETQKSEQGMQKAGPARTTVLAWVPRHKEHDFQGTNLGKQCQCKDQCRVAGVGGATVDLMMVAVAWMAGWLAGRGAGRGRTKQAVCIRRGLVYHLPISQTTTYSDTSGVVHPPFTCCIVCWDRISTVPTRQVCIHACRYLAGWRWVPRGAPAAVAQLQSAKTAALRVPCLPCVPSAPCLACLASLNYLLFDVDYIHIHIVTYYNGTAHRSC